MPPPAPHDYVTGYGIDDVIHEEARADTAILFKNKAVALTRGGGEHFVDPTRSAASLLPLRDEPLDVVCCLGVLVPSHDVHDENPPPSHRRRPRALDFVGNLNRRDGHRVA